MEWKDEQWLDWIRQQECIECQSWEAEPHHLKGDLNQSGTGLTAPDWLTMPLCRTCHDEIHRAPDGWRSRQRGWLLKTLILAAEHGMLIRG